MARKSAFRVMQNSARRELKYNIFYCESHRKESRLGTLMPTGAFNICCPRDCVSRHNGGTSGASLKPLRVDSALMSVFLAKVNHGKESIMSATHVPPDLSSDNYSTFPIYGLPMV